MTQNLGVRRTSSSYAQPRRRNAGGRREQSVPVIPYLEHLDARMAKLDALPWAGGVSFVSCGVRLGVRVDDAAIVDQLSPYLPPVREPATTPQVDHLFSLCTRQAGERRGGPVAARLYEGPRLVSRRRDLDSGMQLDLLRSRLEFQVATAAPSRLFVHAGVVEWRGQAILLPGRSRSGKTTLVAALLRAGAKYYSDDFAVLDASGRVHPWARPLRIRRPALPPQYHPVESLGECAGQSSLPVGLIVVTAHRPGARWRPRPLSPGQALLALIRHTLIARARPDLTIKILGRAVRGARAFASRRDEANAVAATLLSNESSEEDCNHTPGRHIARGRIR